MSLIGKTTKANELRIGNLVTPMVGERAHIMRVEYIGHDVGGPLIDKDYEEYLTHHWQDLEYDQISPIPLTEEWLDRAGFKNNKRNIWYIDFSQNRRIHIYFDNFVWRVGLNEYLFKSIDNLHQLQNLYFALTGEELILK